MTFKVRYRKNGKHVWCALFIAQAPDRTFALCGTFRVRAEEEFEALREAFSKIQFVEDPEPIRDEETK